jgi:hypothetical protein
MFGSRRQREQELDNEFKVKSPPKYKVGQKIYYIDGNDNTAIRSIAWVNIATDDSGNRHWVYTTNSTFEELLETDFEPWLSKQEVRDRKLNNLLS